MRVQNFLSALTIFFLFTLCTSYDPADSEYMNTIVEQREAKNLDFRTAEHSPIKPDMKSEFEQHVRIFPSAIVPMMISDDGKTVDIETVWG